MGHIGRDAMHLKYYTYHIIYSIYKIINVYHLGLHLGIKSAALSYLARLTCFLTVFK